MGLFDLFKNKKTEEITTASGGTYFETNISDNDLTVLTNKAIDIFQNHPGFNHTQLVAEIKKQSRDENLALALYRFIPMAYCRLLFPEPEYSDEYIVHKSQQDQQTFKLSSDRIYTVVFNVAKTRFATEPSQDKLVSILVQSADFNAINDALNRGSDIKDLVCSPSFFV